MVLYKYNDHDNNRFVLLFLHCVVLYFKKITVLSELWEHLLRITLKLLRPKQQGGVAGCFSHVTANFYDNV